MVERSGYGGQIYQVGFERREWHGFEHGNQPIGPLLVRLSLLYQIVGQLVQCQPEVAFGLHGASLLPQLESGVCDRARAGAPRFRAWLKLFSDGPILWQPRDHSTMVSSGEF